MMYVSGERQDKTNYLRRSFPKRTVSYFFSKKKSSMICRSLQIRHVVKPDFAPLCPVFPSCFKTRNLKSISADTGVERV